MTSSNDCPCLEILPSQTADILTKLLNYSDNGINTTIGSSHCRNEYHWQFNLSEICDLPIDYGISCKKHDLLTRRSCDDTISNSVPSYCNLEWCYVDEEKCFHSNHTMFGDKDIPGLYYSYSTCSGDLPIDFSKVQKLNTLHGADLTVSFPGYEFPFHFKSDMGPNDNYEVFDYTNLQGAIVEYLDFIAYLTGINSLTYQTPSGGAMKKHDNNSYNAVVRDINKRVTDIGGGLFWMTADRMEHTTFTAPILTTPLYLYELDKSKLNIGTAIENTFQPFTNNLWKVISACVIVVGIARICFSNARSHHEWHRILNSNSRKVSSRTDRAINALRVYIFAVNKSFIDYFGQASDIEDESNLPHKVLLTGFGFFILIVSNTYTANLATFLTTKNFDGYVLSMDDAVKSNMKICGHFVLKTDFEDRWPKLKEVNLMKYIDESYFSYIAKAYDYLKSGECDVMIGDETDFYLIPEQNQSQFCEMQIVSIKAPVMPLQKGFPVRSEHQANMSKAILETPYFEMILETYATKALDCKLYLDNKGVENEQMDIINMFFPFTVLSACIFVAICSKLITICTHKHKIKKRGEPIENSRLKKKRDESILNDLNENFNTDDIDELEYKYRLDLISLNIQMLQQNYEKYVHKNHRDRKQRSR